MASFPERPNGASKQSSGSADGTSTAQPSGQSVEGLLDLLFTMQEDNAVSGGQDALPPSSQEDPATPKRHPSMSGSATFPPVTQKTPAAPQGDELPPRGRLQRVLWQLRRLEPAAGDRPLEIPALPPPRPRPIAPPAPDLTEVHRSISHLEQDISSSITHLEQKVNHLEHQLYEPTELINPLLPLITELLRGHTESLRGEAFETLVPIIDQIIKEKSRQDRAAMASALAAIIPTAISQHIDESQEELAQALGPAMGKAIQEQVRVERDAMVDALYPVIGNTVSKYMVEVVRSINQQVENTLSVEGLSRRFRARMQGVSEAELILREAMHFSIKAIFLIHKASGLVIAEVQETEGIREAASEEGRMEADMIAGMLTAIRSFANDCVSQSSGNVSELSEIEYDNFKIALEVAGYCYLAVVGQGDPPKSFVEKMRFTLAAIVQRHNKFIENYDGDSDSVPPEVLRLLTALMESFPSVISASSQRQAPPALLIILAGILLGALMLFGMWRYREARYAKAETQVREALASTPELAVYRLEAEAKDDTLTLSGNLPTESLRLEAERIAAAATDEFWVSNQILAVEVPPDPDRIREEIDRLATLFNSTGTRAIAATFADGQVSVQGLLEKDADASTITKAFERIPGVRRVVLNFEDGMLPLRKRLYFGSGSTDFTGAQEAQILDELAQFLKRYPKLQVNIIGHTDPRGGITENRQLARQRAESVRTLLVKRGIDAQRLQVQAVPGSPADVGADQPLWQSRCVRFEPVGL